MARITEAEGASKGGGLPETGMAGGDRGRREVCGEGRALKDLLRDTSRSFYLSLRVLPGPLREPLSLAYLVARASDTLADSSRADLSGRLRALDAMREALRCGAEGEGSRQVAAREAAAREAAGIAADSPAEQRLLAGTGRVLEAVARQEAPVRREIHRVLETITGGQRQDLIRFGYAHPDAPVALATAAECEAYTYAVAGCVGEFWTRVCALQMPRTLGAPLEDLLHHGRRLGQGLQLVNILRDLPADLARGCCYLPKEEMDLLGTSPGELATNPAVARRITRPWMQKAREWLSHGEQYVEGIRGMRLRLSVILPRRLGFATLELLEKNPPLETNHRVRIDRRGVYRCMWESVLEALRIGS